MLRGFGKPALVALMVMMALWMGPTSARASNGDPAMARPNLDTSNPDAPGADTSGAVRSDWVRSATTTAVTYGSIYTAVLVAVQTARVIITAVTPFEFLATAQTFGIPLFVVPIMAQLIPAVRQWAPQATDTMARRWATESN